MHLHSFLLVFFAFCSSTESLQSGYTCETSVSLSCPEATKIVILEVSYSSECPNVDEMNKAAPIYAPSHCLAYDRERVASLCNGKRTCTVDHTLGQRPSFVIGKQANCAFKGQSINVEYSCVPEFYSSQLPRIDICSLQSLNGVKEGFIHTPNYPNGYPNSRTCTKTVPTPEIGHRLKIFALDFDIEGLSVVRFFGFKRVNDWFQINNSGEKMFGTRPAFTLLFDDIIEASLMFKSDFANSKRPYNGLLLYFIVTPIRGPRPATTSTAKTSTVNTSIPTVFEKKDESLTTSVDPKAAALVLNDRQSNNVGLTLLVVLLSGILFVIVCAFLLYKRRNDRRVRYLTDMFNSFFPSRSSNVTLNTTDHGDETTLNNTVISKLDLSIGQHDEKKFAQIAEEKEEFHRTPALKHVNINEKSCSQEKQIFIENLKACPSPYSSHRRTESKFNAKEQLPVNPPTNSNIYSEDPLSTGNATARQDTNSLLYEYVDLRQQQEQNPSSLPATQSTEQEEVIYDVINTANERAVSNESEYQSGLYAIPKSST